MNTPIALPDPSALSGGMASSEPIVKFIMHSLMAVGCPITAAPVPGSADGMVMYTAPMAARSTMEAVYSNHALVSNPAAIKELISSAVEDYFMVTSNRAIIDKIEPLFDTKVKEFNDLLVSTTNTMSNYAQGLTVGLESTGKSQHDKLIQSARVKLIEATKAISAAADAAMCDTGSQDSAPASAVFELQASLRDLDAQVDRLARGVCACNVSFKAVSKATLGQSKMTFKFDRNAAKRRQDAIAQSAANRKRFTVDATQKQPATNNAKAGKPEPSTPAGAATTAPVSAPVHEPKAAPTIAAAPQQPQQPASGAAQKVTKVGSFKATKQRAATSAAVSEEKPTETVTAKQETADVAVVTSQDTPAVVDTALAPADAQKVAVVAEPVPAPLEVPPELEMGSTCDASIVSPSESISAPSATPDYPQRYEPEEWAALSKAEKTAFKNRLYQEKIKAKHSA